jgi:hypothetical protein
MIIRSQISLNGARPRRSGEPLTCGPPSLFVSSLQEFPSNHNAECRRFFRYMELHHLHIFVKVPRKYENSFFKERLIKQVPFRHVDFT